MNIIEKLPAEYKPVSELNLCSNILTNVTVPIAVNDDPILLIGDGSVPLVWLAAPVSPTSSTWRFIVEKSKSQNPAVEVQMNYEHHGVDILISGSLVLRVNKFGPDRATVSKLDFKPLGLAVTGDINGLVVGSGKLASNRITNSVIAFGF